MPVPNQSIETETSTRVTEAYSTPLGKMLIGRIEDALTSEDFRDLEGKVNLIFTSPPFPLKKKKKYGNLDGEEYLEWLKSLAPRLSKLLTADGSIVIEVGNSWERGVPVMSTLPLEALIAFKISANLNLCQQMICHNPARLPSPAQWVNVQRVRLKDSYTHVWWMSPVTSPKADNRKVLLPYSENMKTLLKSGRYNSGKRPSGHIISETGFLKDHGGAIPSNVFDDCDRVPSNFIKISGTSTDRNYRQYCNDNNHEIHPARMQMQLASFFINFLTDESDLVLDPFAGSNTTGFVAENLNRRWIGVEANSDYASGSRGRFSQFNQTKQGGDHVEE